MVALAIFNLCKQNGNWTETSADRIGWFAGMGWRQAVRHIRSLETIGILEVERRAGHSMQARIRPGVIGDTGRETVSPGKNKKLTPVMGDTPLANFSDENAESIGKQSESGKCAFCFETLEGCICNISKFDQDQDQDQKLRHNRSTKRSEIEKGSIEVIRQYRTRWSKQYGSSCVVSGRDRSKAVELVRKLGLDEVIVRLERYLTDRDSWLVDRAHTFPIFAAKINQYVGRQNGKATIARHEDFDREVEQFEKSQRGESER
jgi:hypothetical protein